MNLLRVRAGGFSNIKAASLKLSDLTALVSLNSYGKSNLLSAIDFGVRFIRANANKKEEMMRYRSRIPLNKCNTHQNYFFEFEAEVLVGSLPCLVNYYYEFQWGIGDKRPAKIVSEQLKVKENQKGKKYSLLISRDQKACYKSSRTGRCSTKINIESNELIINKLQAFDQLYFLDLVKQINLMIIYVDHHLDASFNYDPDPLIYTELDGIDDNIPRSIFYLKKEYKEKYELLKDAYMQLFPNITNIDVDEIPIEPPLKELSSNDIPFVFGKTVYTMRVNDKFLCQPIGFEHLSDGAKRVFLMLTFAVIADIRGLSLIAFEELENSIHPSLMQSFLRVITQLSSNCKIIITSHSPYILQYIEPSNIYIGMPNEHCLATFRGIPSNKSRALLKDADATDASIGDYVFELMSGSQEDLKQLGQYLGPCHE